MAGTYKFYIGRCEDCEKEDFFPTYEYKNTTNTTCGFCGGVVHIDKTETFEGKK